MARLLSSVPLTEALVGLGLATATEAVNILFFEHSSLGIALALQTAFIGFLLAVQRLNLDHARRADQVKVDKMAEFLDLQRGTSFDGLRALNDRYASITEVEFRVVKDQVVGDAHEQLRRLAIDKRSETLQTTQYYEWILRQFARSASGEYMHAVSLSSDEEWNNSQLEKNFLEANIQAAARGVQIHRIFIVSDTRFSAFSKRTPIVAHKSSANRGLHGHVVSLEELTKYDPKTLASVGEGFIDFNGRVGLVDIFDSTGQARGQVTMLREDLERMGSIYERLLNMSKSLD